MSSLKQVNPLISDEHIFIVISILCVSQVGIPRDAKNSLIWYAYSNCVRLSDL